MLGSIEVYGGRLYIADTGHHRIRAVDLDSGRISTFVGTGTPGFSGDGGRGDRARLFRPEFIALDDDGNLFIADTFNHRVRRVDRQSGVIETVAGTGHAGYNGDDKPAREASLFSPEGLAVDGQGNLYIADMGNDRVRKVAGKGGTIATVAGTGAPGFNGDGQAGTATQLNFPLGLAIESSGGLLIADMFNHRVRRLDLQTSIVSTVAGNGEPGDLGDGSSALSAQLFNPEGIAVSKDGDIFVADHTNSRVRMVDAKSGAIRTVAGNGVQGFAGDGGPADEAEMFSPARVAVANGQVFVAETGNHLVRRIELAKGTISTVVGGHVRHPTGGATTIRLAHPAAIAVQGDSLYISDSGHHRVLRMSLDTGLMEPLAGTGQAGFSGDGGAATEARLSVPQGLSVDDAGDVLVADSGNNRVRRIAKKDGVIATIARGGPDGIDRRTPAAVAARTFIVDVSATSEGDVLLVDMGNSRVVKVPGAGRQLGTFGNVPGTADSEPLNTFRPLQYRGGGPSANTMDTGVGMHQPKRIVIGPKGSTYVVDTGNNRILNVPSTGPTPQ